MSGEGYNMLEATHHHVQASPADDIARTVSLFRRHFMASANRFSSGTARFIAALLRCFARFDAFTRVDDN